MRRNLLTKVSSSSRFSFRRGPDQPTGSTSMSCRVPAEYNYWPTTASDKRKKMVVLLGATGSGKTRLSIDLASRFDGEIINSDKMQLYQGLDITTNKISLGQRRGIRHHLLGDIDPSLTEVSPSHYRSLASSAISDISSRSKLPVLAGGSNSFVYALLAQHFRPECHDVFANRPNPASRELRYDCCFLWVDTATTVLDSYLEKRVDDMLQSGMVNELADFYSAEGVDTGTRPALRNAIGVPEFSNYFRRRCQSRNHESRGTVEQEMMFREAVRAIKENTCRLARAQMEKIRRLGRYSWNLRRMETTDVLRALMSPESHPATADAVYRNRVLEPAADLVHRWLQQE